MNRFLKYCCVIMLMILLAACTNPFQKKTNWKITLAKKDKKPYGSFLAFESLKYFFPGAKIIPLSAGFRYSTIDGKMMNTERGTTLLIALGLDFRISEPEKDKLIAFVKEGNEVVIFSRLLDDKIERLLQCTIEDNGYEEVQLTLQNDGSANQGILSFTSNPSQKFGYQGKSILGHFRLREEDTSHGIPADHENLTLKVSDTVGLVREDPNFIRYTVGKGHITLHAAPLVMSNYFLLQNNNRHYLESVWGTLPDNITRIYWNDYYKRTTKSADLSVLLKYPATRWAFIFAAFSLLAYVVFEGKRKQKIVPVIAPLENSSVSFVQTVGRLYYHEADHTNLGEKIIQHFLEWVKTHYFMSTNQLDENFTKQLTLKSGLPDTVVRSLVELIREVHLKKKRLDETDLFHLHHTIQRFYKSYGK